MQVALPPGSPPDVEAITLSGMNVVLVSLPPQAAYIPDLRRVLSHEMAHVRIHEVTQEAHDRVPLWLSEGLATSVQYAFVPDPLPPDQDAGDYTLAEPLACALNGLEQLGDLPFTGSALVVGAGAIGVMLARLLLRRGLEQLAIADVSEDRLRLASRLLPREVLGIDSRRLCWPLTSHLPAPAALLPRPAFSLRSG